MARYAEAAADFEQAAELYEAPHDTRGDLHDAESARLRARNAAQRSTWDLYITVFATCAIAGYSVFKYLRSRRKPVDKRTEHTAWAVLLGSVTVIPLLVVAALKALGWSPGLVSVIQIALVASAGTAAGSGLIAILSWAWSRRRPGRTRVGGLARTARLAEKMPPRCPSCGAVIPKLDEIRFCHNCGAALEPAKPKGCTP